MKRAVVLLASAVLVVGFAPVAEAAKAPGGSGGLSCYSATASGIGDYGGTCAEKGGVFTLTRLVQDNDFAGVYIVNGSQPGGREVRGLGLSFTYSGDTSAASPTFQNAGAPRFQVPLSGGGYAYIPWTCDTNGDHVVTPQEPGCMITDSHGYSGLASAYTGTTGTISNSIMTMGDPGVTKVWNINLAHKR